MCGTARTYDQAAQMQINCDHIATSQVVAFASGSDQIDPASYPILDHVDEALLSTPAIKRLRIEGHTDNSGRKPTNLVRAAPAPYTKI
jgi:OmpA-OmpF porin, OOP family